jgi:hypothetical protein
MIAERFTVEKHFEGKTPAVHQTYNRLLQVLKPMGPIGTEPKKTSIHLMNGTAFAGIATRKDYLILTIKSDRQLDSPRIHKVEQVSARRYHSEIKLATPADVDDELIGWLKNAYALSA